MLSICAGFATICSDHKSRINGNNVKIPHLYTPLETNECPLKRDYFNRKYILQPLIFRGHPLVFGGISPWKSLPAFLKQKCWGEPFDLNPYLIKHG